MQTHHHQHSSLIRWSLIVGIGIVLNMFFNYAISLVYKEPQYPVSSQVVDQYQTVESCIAVGGQWNPDTMSTQKEPTGYCDPDYTKRMDYDKAHAAYNRTVFVVLAILGIASLIGGVLIANAIVSTAFSWGGVLSLVIASLRYWSDADSLIKVLILAVALGGLIWVALKKVGTDR